MRSQMSVRIPGEMLAKIDAVIKYIIRPGEVLNRNDMIRMLIAEALMMDKYREILK